MLSGGRPFFGGHLCFAVPAFHFGITQMEANDSIFEFVFSKYLREDGSGEKGFERLNKDFVFHVERECPRFFPR